MMSTVKNIGAVVLWLTWQEYCNALQFLHVFPCSSITGIEQALHRFFNNTPPPRGAITLPPFVTTTS